MPFAVPSEAFLAGTDAAGKRADNGESDPAISDDPRVAAFQDSASNLAPRDAEIGAIGVVLQDPWAGEPTPISAIPAGNAGAANGAGPFVTDFGIVVFADRAGCLVAGGANGSPGTFSWAGGPDRRPPRRSRWRGGAPPDPQVGRGRGVLRYRRSTPLPKEGPR
jgi:hypothetical protein